MKIYFLAISLRRRITVPVPARGLFGSLKDMNMDAKIKPASRVKLFPGVWIVAGVLALIAICGAWQWSKNPRNLKQLAKELSSINVIQKSPVVNHARTLVGMIHTTEQGMGVFIADIESKDERKLIEVQDVNYAPNGAWTFGWSPDDKFFAFSLTNLFFWDGTGNKFIGEVVVTNGIEPFAWLSPTSCAYIDRSPKLILIQLVNGQWQQTASWLLPATNGQPRSLIAMETNTVAWLTTNILWQMDISSGAIKSLYSDSPKIIASASYSKGQNAFLLVENTIHSTDSSLIDLSTGAGDPMANELMRKPSIISAQWLNKGQGYAYVINRGSNTVLTVKKDDAAEDTIFKGGQVWSIFCSGEDSRVYALAAQNSEPAGIWQYDASADNLACIVSPWGNRNVEFHFQPALAESATYQQDGRKHNAKFSLVPPANFSRHKKYPLVIGTAFYEWTPIAHGIYAQCLANCGAYVALVNYSWDQKNHPETVYQMTNNVLAVYNQLAKNPNIDTSRVFLFGFSAGTAVMSELVKDYPGRWRGIMLLNPSPLPPATAGMTGSVLATAGSGEGEERDFQRYQEELLKVGIPMEWHIHENAQHVVRDQEAMFERTLFMGDMVFKN